MVSLLFRKQQPVFGIEPVDMTTHQQIAAKVGSILPAHLISVADNLDKCCSQLHTT